LCFIIGLNKKKSPNISLSIKTPPVSVIIAIYNGEKTLPRLINSLKNQNYTGIIEFILCDDGSTDNSSEIIKAVALTDPRFKYTHSKFGDSQLNLKKRNLDAGIKFAQHEILLFTDVDCIIQLSWVSSMIKNFTNEVDFLIGYSEVDHASSWVAKFQKIDFFLLMAAARAMSNLGFSWACSGQNIAYRRSLFEKVGGFSKLTGKLQGDDSLFLQLCRKIGNARVKFVMDRDGFVRCRTETKLFPFIKQRLRWSGDANIMWQYNKIFFISILCTFLTNAGLFCSVFVYRNAVFDHSWIINLFLLKFCIELSLLLSANNRFDRHFTISSFVKWFIIQIPFIFFMGVGSFFAKQLGWRGRKLT
jgi:cellulose synthase/poly-beta-1,6-N-acetylglucosamine synthase-like glycosyltransferase